MDTQDKINIISCVGQRALAVISPINTILQHQGRAIGEARVALFTTDQTIGFAEKCKEWLEEHFPGIMVDPIPFKQAKERIETCSINGDTLYFNTNPGMNWEIATLALFLPEHTKCLYADIEYLYVWRIADDIENAERLRLHEIGIESYNKLSPMVQVDERTGVNEALSVNIQKILGENSFNRFFVLSGRSLKGAIKDAINRHLVWVREKFGNLYLLIDLQSKGDAKELKDLFRTITAVLDPLNFTITVITDQWHVKNRAVIEGVSFIYIDKVEARWKRKIVNWISGDWKITPKKILPNLLHQQTGTTISGDKEMVRSALFACLGDNIETTLTAIHSHQTDKVYMFYDRTSPRISYFAGSIKDYLKDADIDLIPTDNKGGGIINAIEGLSKLAEKIGINITPGVKSAVGDHIGKRTKRVGYEAAKKFEEAGILRETAIAWGKKIADDFADTEAKDPKDPFKETLLKQPIHLSHIEYGKLNELIATICREKRAPRDDELAFLSKEHNAVDIAMFGRMLAVKGKQDLGLDGAVQVSHAFTVHEVAVEDDYFTAVDDLNEGPDAAHIGETEFASGVFYLYICIKRDLLVENLEKKDPEKAKELADKTLAALVESAAKIAPTGHQNSFASRARTSYMLAEKGSDQPRSLMVAFLKPIKGEDILTTAISELEKRRENFDKVYGPCADGFRKINTETAEGSLNDIISFIKE